MKLSWFFDASGKGRVVACIGAGALLLSSTAAMAATDIVLWHSLSPHNKDVFEDLVRDFNKEQGDVRVKLKAYADEDAVEAALAALKKNDTRPQLVQLDDDRSPEKVAARSYIQPLSTLLAKHPIKDAKWFLSEKNTFARDGKGRLLAFPYMIDIPVMYYNIDAFKRADLKPAAPERDWAKLQAQLVTLANNGSRKCPLTSDQPVSVNLENLAAVNNQLYATNHNGLEGKGKPAFAFDVLYIRHLSMMISWVKSELMVKPEFNATATKRFANGECAVLFSTSSNIGWFRDSRKLDFALTGLPYYPAITSKPGNAFVSGSALWVTSGHSKESDAASAKFLAWLAQPKRAAQWHQDTGFLPLTEQAFAETDKSFYKKLGDWRELIAAYDKNPPANGRGFRIDNYPQIRAMFHKTLETALSGNETAPTAIKAAAAEASKMMSSK